MENFKFNLQLFAAVDLTGANITIQAAAAATSTSTLYVAATDEVYATEKELTDAGKTLVATISLSSSVDIAAAATTVTNLFTSVSSSAATASGFVVPTNRAYSVTDTSKAEAYTLGATTSVLTGDSFSVNDSGEVTSFSGLSVTIAAAHLNGSGTVVVNDVNATASSVDAEVLTTGGVITNFDSGSLEVPTTAALKINNATLNGTGGKFTALTTDGVKYTEAAFTGAGVTANLSTSAADRPFHVIGTDYADTFTTSAAKKDTIVSGAGNDTITVASTAAVSIDAGAGNDSIKGSVATTNATVLGGDGNDKIEFNTAASSNLYISGDAGNDELILATTTNSTVLGGAGSDTLDSSSKTNILTGGDGADYFVASALTNQANISDYKYTEDYLVVGSANIANDVKTLVTAKKFKYDGTNGFINNGGTIGDATVTSSEGYFAVKMQNAAKDKLGVGWVGENGVEINAGSEKDAVILIGTTNSAGDTLIGGSKNDTIYAGANDSVYGGAGSDSITMDAKTYGVYVGLSSAGGADEVKNFTSGWNIEAADAVYMIDGTAEDLKVANTGTDVTLKSGSATMTLAGAGATSEANLLISDKKVDVIAKGKEAVVTDDSTIADYYIGTESSGIDMTKYTGDVEVNLANDMFRNIATLKAGSGNMSVLGGKAAESLIGGDGATSLYGGAGVDTLVSGKGKTTFFANESSGKDVVSKFAVGTDETSDVINVNALKSLTRADDKNFTVNLDGTNSLKVNQASGSFDSNIQWASGDSKGAVKIGKTANDNKFSYDATTTNYVGSTKTDTVSLKSGTTDSFEVWVDQTGDMFNSIEVYDFSQTTGDVLAAGKANTSETIVAGKGSSSLWGGTGSSKDVLKNSNSSATAEFFYGLGDGNDEIQGQKGDSVNLYNLSLSDITKAEIGSNNVVFTTTAKETVTVSGSVGTFKLADGSSWTANYSSKTWTQN